MRICLVSQEYPPETGGGGIGTQTYLKARGLAARGHDILVVAGSWDKQPRDYSVENVRICRVGEPDPGVDGFEYTTYLLANSFAVARKLHELKASTAFDIVQFPEYGADGFIYQADTFSHKTAKYIVQLHGPLAMFSEILGWPTQGSTFQEIGCFMEGMVTRRADRLMASSHNIAAFSARYFGLDLHSINVIHSGVDIEQFAPAREQLRATERRLLFVGNLVGDKGIGLLIDALKQLREVEPRLHLRAIGKGSSEQITQFRERSAVFGISDRVEIIGYVPYNELPAHYAWCDIFAGPSTFEPGAANVYLEAMSSGKPVIACNSGGAPEAVLDGKTGLLVPPRDTDALAEAILELCHNDDRRVALGRAARLWVEERFAMEKYLDRVEGIYREVLET